MSIVLMTDAHEQFIWTSVICAEMWLSEKTSLLILLKYECFFNPIKSKKLYPEAENNLTELAAM